MQEKWLLRNNIYECIRIDRATGVGAQAAEDILKELQNNEQDTEDILEELQTNEQDIEQFSVNNAEEMGTKDLFGTNDSPCPSTPHVRTPTASGTSKGRKHKVSVDVTALSDCIIQAVDTLSTNLKDVGQMLSKSFQANTQEQMTMQLYNLLSEISDLPMSERTTVYMKCIRDSVLMTGLFNLPLGQRLDFIRRFVL